MGDIGKIVREVEIEPIPTDEPVHEPSPQPEKEKTPA